MSLYVHFIKNIPNCFIKYVNNLPNKHIYIKSLDNIPVDITSHDKYNFFISCVFKANELMNSEYNNHFELNNNNDIWNIFIYNNMMLITNPTFLKIV